MLTDTFTFRLTNMPNKPNIEGKIEVLAVSETDILASFFRGLTSGKLLNYFSESECIINRCHTLFEDLVNKYKIDFDVLKIDATFKSKQTLFNANELEEQHVMIVW